MLINIELKRKVIHITILASFIDRETKFQYYNATFMFSDCVTCFKLSEIIIDIFVGFIHVAYFFLNVGF